MKHDFYLVISVYISFISIISVYLHPSYVR